MEDDTERAERTLPTKRTRMLLPSLRSEVVFIDGQREQEEVLSLQPCIFGHKWHPYRDLRTGYILFECDRCNTRIDWNKERIKGEVS